MVFSHGPLSAHKIWSKSQAVLPGPCEYSHSLDGNHTSAYGETIVPNIIFGEISFSCRRLNCVCFLFSATLVVPSNYIICYGKFVFGRPLKEKIVAYRFSYSMWSVWRTFFPSYNNKAISRQPKREQRTRCADKTCIEKFNWTGKVSVVSDFCNKLCVTCVCHRWTTTLHTYLYTTYTDIIFIYFSMHSYPTIENDEEKNHHKMVFFLSSSNSILLSTAKMEEISREEQRRKWVNGERDLDAQTKLIHWSLIHLSFKTLNVPQWHDEYEIQNSTIQKTLREKKNKLIRLFCLCFYTLKRAQGDFLLIRRFARAMLAAFTFL